MKGYLPYLYNNLSPGESFELNFEDDLFELFGSEDLSEIGLVGKWNSHVRDFESARWNWGSTNLKGFVGLLYMLKSLENGSRFELKEFERFYKRKIMHQKDIVQNLQEKGLVPVPFRMIYTLRYRSYYFPALMLRIRKMEWNPKEHPKYPIYITFVPETYFVVESTLWEDLDRKIRDKNYWKGHLEKKYCIKIKEDIERVLRSYAFSQNIYRVMPFSLFTKRFLPNIKKSENGIFYLKRVERRQPDLALSDNQIFWGLFHQITNTTQVLYPLELRVDDERYLIQNLSINTLSDRTDVFRQEAGTANVICHVLFDIFGRRYLNSEFGTMNTIKSSETSILKRAVKLKKVAESPTEEFANTNYDYATFLRPLDVDHTVLFSLTVGLWHKGRKSYNEYLDQWREMVFNTPITTENVTVVWFIAPDTTERKFFSDPTIPDKSLENMINRTIDGLSSDNWQITDGKDFKLQGKKIVILAQFRETPQSKNVRKELENLLKQPRQTRLYHVAKQVIQDVSRSTV